MKVITLLLEQKIITKAEFDSFITTARKEFISIDKLLVRKEKISYDTLIKLYDKKFKLLKSNYTVEDLKLEMMKRFTINKLEELEFIPLSIDKDGKMEIISVYDDIEYLKQPIKVKFSYTELKTNVVHRDLFNKLIEDFNDNFNKYLSSEWEEKVFMSDDLSTGIEKLVAKAEEIGASDIHIDPKVDGSAIIKVRVLGDLLEISKIKDIETTGKLVNILTERMNMGTVKPFEPYGSMVVFKLPHKEINVRVHIIPTKVVKANNAASEYSYKITMRLLGESKNIIPLTNYGYLPEDVYMIKKTMLSGKGMVILGGPTGSGKTTSVYSILEYVSSGRKNIMSLEDPAEILVDFINQVHIDPAMKDDWAPFMKEIVRHDFDMLFTGEMRDQTIANLAIGSANIGRLVISTIHISGAVGIVSRLEEMKVPLTKATEVVKMVIAQELIKVVCPHCKKPTNNEIVSDIAKRIYNLSEDQVLYTKGAGCEHCRDGYISRVPVYEILMKDSKTYDYFKNGDTNKLSTLLFRTKAESLKQNLFNIDIDEAVFLYEIEEDQIEVEKERVMNLKIE